MSGNSFGTLFRINTFGESHGPGIGVVIDGCPAGLKIDMDRIRQQLGRRRPGQSRLTTSRNEPDDVACLSGLLEDTTTGAPITFFIKNRDARPGDYQEISELFRPSHADFTYFKKYGIRDHRGGGRSSARETAARVAAGAVAIQLLERSGVRIQAYVSQIGTVSMPARLDWTPFEKIEDSLVRCPEPHFSRMMEEEIERAKVDGDSLGGIISAYADGISVGLGMPVFDRLEADLAKAMLSINACKGFEIGSGFAGSAMKGSEHNDPYYSSGSSVKTLSNHSGGVQGGISNGMPIYFRCAFKPTSTIAKEQRTVSKEGEDATIAAKGRHDPCVVPRAVPIVEAMTALVLADHWLRSRTDRMDQLTSF